MKYNVISTTGTEAKEIELESLIVVGFAGKDVKKTMEHIKELEEEGIKCPKTVPVVYQCSKEILTTSNEIEVIGDKTSGEVEYLVLVEDGKYYIGLGSDHTDRSLEANSIHKSKQVCMKPHATDFWPYEEVKAHFDTIKLVSNQILDGQKIEYQAGVTADLLSIDTIIAKIEEEMEVGNSLIYTGTVPLHNGFQYGSVFSCALIDETLNRTITLEYNVKTIVEH